MIRTDGTPTICTVNLTDILSAQRSHVTEEELVDEYIDYLLSENGYYLGDENSENIWDDPWAENDWLFEQDKPRDLMWDTEPEMETHNVELIDSK